MSKQTSKELVDLKEIKRDLQPLTKLPVIKTDKHYEDAREKFKLIGQLEKELKTRKEKITKPLNQALKEARDLFRPYEDQLKELSGSWADILGEYANARENARIKALEAINSDKRLKNTATIQNKLNEIESRAAGTMRIKTLDIQDPAQIPEEFWVIDEVKLRAVLIAGQEVPGARLIESLTVTKR